MDNYTMAKWISEIEAERGVGITADNVCKVLNFLGSEAHCFNGTTLEHYINAWRNSDNLETETLFNRLRIDDFYKDELKQTFDKRGFVEHDGIFYFKFKDKEYVHNLEYPRISDDLLKEEYNKWVGTWRYEGAGEGTDYDAFAFSKANWHLRKLDKEIAKRELIIEEVAND